MTKLAATKLGNVVVSLGLSHVVSHFAYVSRCSIGLGQLLRLSKST